MLERDKRIRPGLDDKSLTSLQHNNDTSCVNTTIISVNEFGSSDNIKLLKVTDLLGKKTKSIKNKPLFYIYDDGSVEKRFIID